MAEKLPKAMGSDFSGVRVHYNSAMPAHLNALAYAQGSDIHLAPTAPNPLGHELAHVVQQQGGPRRGRHHEGLAADRIIAATAHPIDP